MATRGKKIFISYRREDASDVAGRIRDWLVQTRRITRDDIFMDVAAILPGADFMKVITDSLKQCRAVIVVISPSWLRQINTPGTSYVRAETEIALDLGITIIPVLVGGAKLPSEDQLPESLRPLKRLNAQPLRHETFDYDMGLVRRTLRLGTGRSTGWVAAISALLIVALGLGALTQGPATKANPLYLALHPPTPTASPTATATVTPSPTATPSPGMLVISDASPVHTQAVCGSSFAAKVHIQNTGGKPVQFQVAGKTWSSVSPANGILQPNQTEIINFQFSGGYVPTEFGLVWSNDLSADLGVAQGTFASVPLVCP